MIDQIRELKDQFESDLAAVREMEGYAAVHQNAPTSDL